MPLQSPFSTYLSGQRVNGAEECRFPDRGDHANEQREDEERQRIVDPLQEPEDDVGHSGQKGPVDEELPRSDRLDVLAKDRRREDGGDENRPVNLNAPRV